MNSLSDRFAKLNFQNNRGNRGNYRGGRGGYKRNFNNRNGVQKNGSNNQNLTTKVLAKTLEARMRDIAKNRVIADLKGKGKQRNVAMYIRANSKYFSFRNYVFTSQKEVQRQDLLDMLEAIKNVFDELLGNAKQNITKPTLSCSTPGSENPVVTIIRNDEKKNEFIYNKHFKLKNNNNPEKIVTKESVA